MAAESKRRAEKRFSFAVWAVLIAIGGVAIGWANDWFQGERVSDSYPRCAQLSRVSVPCRTDGPYSERRVFITQANGYAAWVPAPEWDTEARERESPGVCPGPPGGYDC